MRTTRTTNGTAPEIAVTPPLEKKQEDAGSDATPDPEVSEKPKRRRYSADYKQRILREADACTKPGEIGALLRREGLYSSLLTNWRRERERGELDALAPKKRGRKPKRDPATIALERLQREHEKLKDELRKAQLVIDVQKKVAQILGIPLKTPEDEGKSS